MVPEAQRAPLLGKGGTQRLGCVRCIAVKVQHIVQQSCDCGQDVPEVSCQFYFKKELSYCMAV